MTELADLITESDNIFYYLQEVDFNDPARLRDIMIDMSKLQSGILQFLAKDREVIRSPKRN